MCFIEAPTTHLSDVFFDANSDGNPDPGEEDTDGVYSFDVSADPAELAIPMVLRFNDVVSSNTDCGDLVYEVALTHSAGFDVLANGGSYDIATNELILTQRADYSVGVITVTISVHFVLDPNPGYVTLTATIYVIDCINEGNSMTVTSSHKDTVKVNRFGTSFMGTIGLDLDDSYTFDNSADVYIGAVSLCPIVKYRITCTDPDLNTLVIEDGGVTGASALCSSPAFGYSTTLASREISAIETNFPATLYGTGAALG